MIRIVHFSPILIINVSTYIPQYKNILECSLYYLYFIIIIIELCLPSTIEIYSTFQDLYITVNIYVSKKGYVSL